MTGMPVAAARGTAASVHPAPRKPRWTETPTRTASPTPITSAQVDSWLVARSTATSIRPHVKRSRAFRTSGVLPVESPNAPEPDPAEAAGDDVRDARRWEAGATRAGSR